ncbi:MAG: ferredoxin-NADP reductase [Omnitrophica bacterium RIFCSPLOWO2_12_FULL_44_17]|uniref:Ferredoxin-NADP reductase n=1 Tax=Candidatus Danuiimicrobium aquiferis TaxID=1801832 RepID=A0A1G1KQY3_9BACT|nr:MAG: ferredoxin-NADP reductase [Omnitrophica bacterium RIFCSPHIGHO2_02_FULL_45_28]OGW92452.1 MAG: ferredoxin-NADP reductase [Omnitrophica bacterium RIFCSPHIGHO2_12_FULL_44_12]OGW95326.1 MAG: ferredoxin-NADP reductase [Omnitrophica bacterium RIFCSPLOWO2_12_FULL_44_17]OGX04729.1 MAG: ferredoxin-NADP reductase [Omnitrophica bacterium RIFCSPLOWO2_02_FULL_44_11]
MQIIEKTILTETATDRITKFKIQSPHIARKALPGQFVVLMITEKSERVPLTVVETNPQAGTVTVIVQEIGFSTKLLGKLNVGDSLFAFVGPLGHPTEIKNYGKVILVGGGVGIAEIYLVAKALKEKGNHVVSVLGARTHALLILENEMRNASNELYIATDDGSYGRKGFTTDVVNELLSKSRYDIVYAVGPIPMMKRVADVTKPHQVKTMVSLNSLMVDATGMCGGCRVTVGNEVKFTCVDGPEFEADLVDWEELIKRNKVYVQKEKHLCKIAPNQ